MSSSRDNWERLVEAVVKREQIWQLCHQNSVSPSISTISSQDFSEQILSFSSNNLDLISLHPETGPSISQEDIAIHLGRLHRFSLHELQAATKDFSKENILPGAWDVYRGWLADGSQVAVKSYRDVNFQSADIRFRRELEINNIAAHPNVLRLLGFCYTQQHCLLVYPFMDNGSVATCLRERHTLQPKSQAPLYRRKGKHKSQPPLNWPTRKGIAMGVAKGLVHLHEECDKKILHRDIKAANILLNENFEAVVAYTELSIVVEHQVTELEVAVCGSYGFIAPEYRMNGKCSEKNDVFGYGTFLLELITGLRAFDLALLANDEDFMLLDWVKGKYKLGNWKMIVDANNGGMWDLMQQLMQIALICTTYLPEERPKMSEVVRMLENGDGLEEKWEEWCKNEECCTRRWNLPPQEPHILTPIEWGGGTQ